MVLTKKNTNRKCKKKIIAKRGRKRKRRQYGYFAISPFL